MATGNPILVAVCVREKLSLATKSRMWDSIRGMDKRVVARAGEHCMKYGIRDSRLGEKRWQKRSHEWYMHYMYLCERVLNDETSFMV